MIWLAVAAGGAVGTLARFAIGQWFSRPGFPVATLAINIVGSFLLGALAGWLPARHASPVLSAALTVGVCGGFTTMSTFAFETVSLAEHGAAGRALVYGVLTLVLSVAAAAAGIAAGRSAVT